MFFYAFLEEFCQPFCYLKRKNWASWKGELASLKGRYGLVEKKVSAVQMPCFFLFIYLLLFVYLRFMIRIPTSLIP